jgi:hypothetical protein
MKNKRKRDYNFRDAKEIKSDSGCWMPAGGEFKIIGRGVSRG